MESPQSQKLGAVAIVVVNWNGYDETAECLSSLESLSYPDYRVVVVDNGSTDGSGERLAQDFTWCEFVFNDVNLGFGGGCNAGIEHALSTSVDFVLLLNPDSRISGDALSELVAVKHESGASVVGATIVTEDGVAVNSTPASHPDMFFYSGYRRKLPVPTEKENAYSDQRWFETDRVEGAAALLPRELLTERQQTVGYFLDDSLFMYGEEVELAMWCRENGKKSVIANDAIVEHSSDASSNRAFQLYYLTRNRLLIAHKYFRLKQRIAFDLLFPVTRVAMAIRLIMNGQKGVGRGIFKGLVDGYRNKTGHTW